MRTNFQGSERKRLVFRAVLAIFIALPVFLSTVAGTNAAAAGQWSFEDHPQPPYEQYTKKELGYLDEAENVPADKSACEASVEADYRIYRERYPEFEKSGDPQSNFKNWKHYLVYSNRTYYPICLFIPLESETSELLEKIPTKNFFYCGRDLTDAEITNYPHVAELLAEILDYANSGRYEAVAMIIDLSDYKPNIRLNPDVEYYFRKIVHTDYEPEKARMDTSILARLLSTDRRAFLDKAAETHNLQAVAATTAPCEP